MIGRKSQDHTKDAGEVIAPQGFDDFVMKLGDVMRGERATLGKSLLDVQRELRIKASYIAAIENCDPSAFDTPGFIAGYVRSYARYLNMDPEETFAAFCAESGFTVAHGMSEKASTIRKSGRGDQGGPALRARDPFAEPALPFSPTSDSVFSRIEPGAIGSTLVLLALIGGIGYGGYAVLQEVQRVQVAPVEQTPLVLSELDPLDAAGAPEQTEPDADQSRVAGLFSPPANGGFDRLYRPEALDVPVLTSRDGPISTLDPDSVGLFARVGDTRPPEFQDSANAAAALVAELTDRPSDRLTAATPVHAGVTVVAARPAWVRVSDEAGRVLYTGVMNAGDTFAVPQDANGPVIRVGESGSVYFAVNGQTFGPSGARGQVTNGIALSAEAISERYALADLDADRDLGRVLAELDIRPAAPAPVVQVAEAVPETPFLAQAGRDRAVPQPQLRAFETPVIAERAPVEPEPRPLSFAELALTETASGIDSALRPEPRSPAVAAIGEALRATREAEALQIAAAEEATRPVIAPLPQVQPVQPVQQRVEPVAPFAQRAEGDILPLQPVQPVQPLRQPIPQPRVLAEALPGVTIVAKHEAWIEVTAASGTKLYAETMLPGDTITLPQTEVPPDIFTGDAGAVYFLVGGQTYGPYGERGQFGRDLKASAENVRARLAVADLTSEPDLARMVAELSQQVLTGGGNQ
ncbi:helix-turn-helix domain-containing protein [Cognatishimia sp. F0-27]|uniref:helix-turn-helix domain-containing protein n=1 Tax=Cognatishimia sp. F0-27 TaxID=2816855 RepID=UPI001D0C4553|nr:helix-turn-helix domain-containing protein [Cognatishimia sp. F0-27]MCC1491907.1 DUF4115 domain-containing protein [Cognatishimia sp. F0-27]